jgi:hypothetical protein
VRHCFLGHEWEIDFVAEQKSWQQAQVGVNCGNKQKEKKPIAGYAEIRFGDIL